MNYEKGVLSLFPNAKPLVDFILRDNLDGRGVRLDKWDENKLGPCPTIGAIEAAATLAEEEISIPDRATILYVKLKQGESLTLKELTEVLRARL